MKIVQMSDIHVGTELFRPDLLAHAIEQTNALEPDMVAVVGRMNETRKGAHPPERSVPLRQESPLLGTSETDLAGRPDPCAYAASGDTAFSDPVYYLKGVDERGKER